MQTAKIKYGDYSATVNLSRGANCISLVNARYKARILREPDYSEQSYNPYLYGMPILFPVNRISSGVFSFEGREYTFPVNEPKTGCALHGELHALPFRITEQSDSSVSCKYEATADMPYLTFPHEFAITQKYALTDGGLTHETVIENRSDMNMPYFIGFHTTFNVPFSALSEPKDLRVRVDISREFERNMSNYLPAGVCPSPDSVTRRVRDGESL